MGEGAGRGITDAERTARRVRLLKIVVYIMGVALVIGTVLLVVGIVQQAGRLGQLTSAPIDFALPPGASVDHMALDGDRLAIHFAGGGGEEVVVFDLRSGRLVSRLVLRPPPAANP